MMPASTVGEPVPEADRPARRAEIVSDDGARAGRAMWALSDERSPQMLEQLLIALSKRTIAAPTNLVDYVEDTRVQRALLDAVRTVPLDDLANFAQALGMVGGPGAREALHGRMQEALGDPATFADDSFHNRRAGSATTCAERLLYLDAEDQSAADALVRLMGHACAGNRRSATWKAARVLDHHARLRTQPLRHLRATLIGLIDTADDEVFCALAPPLWNDARVPERLSRLLESRSPEKQQMALSALSKVEHLGWPMLIEWASRPRDPILVLTTLGPNLRLLPERRRAEIAQRGLADAAPTMRHEAAGLLSSLDSSVAARLARQALKDEPDPAIRARLGAYLKRSARPAPRSRKHAPVRRRR